MGRGKGGSNGGGRAAGGAQAQTRNQRNKKKDEMAGVCMAKSLFFQIPYHGIISFTSRWSLCTFH